MVGLVRPVSTCRHSGVMIKKKKTAKLYNVANMRYIKKNVCVESTRDRSETYCLLTIILLLKKNWE